jgi:predicted  nucleic acid-binding Zn-ribbon protein
MTEIECIGCGHVFEVDDYTSGDCPNCNKYSYYWDEAYDYEGNIILWEGFNWEPK